MIIKIMRRAIIFGGFDVNKKEYSSLYKLLKKENFNVKIEEINTASTFEQSVDNIINSINKYKPKIIIAHSLSSPLLYCVSLKNPCILKKTHIAVFGPVQNSDNIENITIPKFLQQDLCVPSIFIKIIGYSLNIFTKNNNILKDITINKIYNIGVVTKSLQYIKDNKQDYRKFLCNDKIFVVLSKCDKLVGYDDKIITNNFINKFILENEDHCEILNDKKIIKKFKLFIRK